MEEKAIHYTKGDVTVVWKPELCQHSTHCWKELREVFDPWIKPWVNMDGAETERIKVQVSKCPSGALSYVENSKNENPNSKG